MRTLSPTSHYEGGEWETRPYAADEARMAGLDLDFHAAQVEEFARAKAEAEAAGARARLVLMDTTAAMLLRPDGHPSRYGHWASENVTLYNDCDPLTELHGGRSGPWPPLSLKFFSSPGP